jgi:hypothetical protein
MWSLSEIKKEEKQIENIEPPKPKKVDVFKVMGSAFSKNYVPSDKEIEKIPEFLFHNWLTGQPELVDLALFLTTHNIPLKAQYLFVRNIIPKCYVKYPKNNKKSQKDIEFIMDYYNCNEITAQQYLDLLSKNDIIRMKKEKELKG